jgi:glycosyltransferase involved in cell wall biosynthesis
MSGMIVTIADTTLGYGSPQIPRLTSSLCDLTGGRAVIFQPLLPSRPAVPVHYPGCEVETIATFGHPHGRIGRWEYIARCAKYIDAYKPDILVLSKYNLFGVLKHASHIPKKIIHLALEGMELLGPSSRLESAAIDEIKRYASRVNYWIFPEANRATNDARILGIPAERICIMYNVSDNVAAGESARNGRILYAGSLDEHNSIGRYIFEPEFMPAPIDIFGDLQKKNTSKWKASLSKDSLKKANLRWFGHFPADRLNAMLPSYNYSIVFWLPVYFSFLNAAPNKFFQAVAASVPVISAPHPQMKMLIERYGCGIIIDGWKKHDLLAGLEQAQALLGTAAYGNMVENCRHAVKKELSWDIQFAKFARLYTGDARDKGATAIAS